MTASNDTVYCVCVQTRQGEFTEPRYYASAEDATKIVAGFRNRDKAKAFAETLRQKICNPRTPECDPIYVEIVEAPLCKSATTAMDRYIRSCSYPN